MVLGDGNLSFSLSLAKSLAKNPEFRMLATTFLSIEELKETYGNVTISRNL